MAIAALVLALALAVACSDSAVGSVDGLAPIAPDGAASVTFTDVAADVGLDFQHGAFRWSVTADPNAMMGAGLCWLDVDRDGWLDLFVVNTWSNGEWRRWDELGDLPTTRLYRNDRGSFVDVTDEMGAGLEVRGNGCVAADLDRDGFPDLYVTTERENVLLWNVEGRHLEPDEGPSDAAAYGWHTGAAVGDVDGNGWPDIFVAGYADMNRPIPEATRGFPNTVQPEPDLLLLNQGADPGERPTFVDVAREVGIEPGGTDYGLGAILSDVDRDGDLDLYVANDTQPNRLYLIEAAPGPAGIRLVDTAPAAGVADDNAGMGVASGDFDVDGLPDLAVTNMAEQGHNVFTSEGAGAPATYSSALGPLGLEMLGQEHTGWGAVWADLDLDGDLDLALAHGAIPVTDLDADRQPLQLYEQQPSASETPRFEAAPWHGEAEPDRYLARGMAAADYDNDGDVDLAVGTIGGDLALLRNDGARGDWLTVEPRPATPGTTVTITTEDGTDRYWELLAGSSYLSSEDPRAHFGFGVADTPRPVRIEVRWPDGTALTMDDVDLGQIVLAQLGE